MFHRLLLFPTCKDCQFSPKRLSDPPCNHPSQIEKLKFEPQFPSGCHFNPPCPSQDFPNIDPWDSYTPLISSKIYSNQMTWAVDTSNDQGIKDQVKDLVKEALSSILIEGEGAQDLIAKIVDIRQGLIREIKKAQKNKDEDPYSSYNEGWSDALDAVLNALDKKLKNL